MASEEESNEWIRRKALPFARKAETEPEKECEAYPWGNNDRIICYLSKKCGKLVAVLKKEHRDSQWVFSAGLNTTHSPGTDINRILGNPHHVSLNGASETLISLHETVNSLHETVNSPHETVNSPQETVNSPRETVNSPQETVNSPREAVNSSHETVNRSHETLNC